MKTSALRRWLREDRGRENAEALAELVDRQLLKISRAKSTRGWLPFVFRNGRLTPRWDQYGNRVNERGRCVADLA